MSSSIILFRNSFIIIIIIQLFDIFSKLLSFVNFQNWLILEIFSLSRTVNYEKFLNKKKQIFKI